MSEEPRYLVRNREMISRLMGIQELRQVVKTQLFGRTVVAVCPSPYPSHRVGPYDVCVMVGIWFTRAYTTVACERYRSQTVSVTRNEVSGVALATH